MKYNQIKQILLNNQKIWLVTGVAGFIGSNLAEALLKLNQKVIVQLNTDAEHSLNARITEIYPAFDKQTQSFYCKAVFTDSLN